MALLKCTDCGNNVSSSALTCSSCGCPASKIEGTEAAEREAAHVKMQKITAEAQAKSQKQSQIVGLITFIVVFILAMIFLFSLDFGDSGTNTSGRTPNGICDFIDSGFFWSEPNCSGSVKVYSDGREYCAHHGRGLD